MPRAFFVVLLATSTALVHCGDDTGTGDGEGAGGPAFDDDEGSAGTGTSTGSTMCATTAYEATVGAFCEKQLSPPPTDPVCIYGGSDVANCVTNLLGEAEQACNDGCVMQFDAWLGCLDAAPVICGVSEADQLCGVERGLLETCCSSCSATSF